MICSKHFKPNYLIVPSTDILTQVRYIRIIKKIYTYFSKHYCLLTIQYSHTCMCLYPNSKWFNVVRTSVKFFSYGNVLLRVRYLISNKLHVVAN